MTVRVVTWPELTPGQARTLPALFTLDGNDVWDVPFLQRLHARPTHFVDYHAVYAVDGDRTLAQIQVIRFPFTTRRGTETVSGLDLVVAHPGALRRGLSTRLLAEVLRRETEAGARWIFLWTRRSWGAHRAYEKAGYRDVFSPSCAQRPIAPGAGGRLPPGYRWRRVRARDDGLLERLLSEATRDRLGFVPRPTGSFGWRFRLRWTKPEEHRILLHRGRPIGYVWLTLSPTSCRVGEIVTVRPAHRGPVLRGLEALAEGRWLVLRNTSFVRDEQVRLHARGYDMHGLTHATLMARPIAGTHPRPTFAELRSVFRDPAFWCDSGDLF